MRGPGAGTIESGAMYFAYVDESGSAGLSGSLSYTLGCVLVDCERWPEVFEDLIEFRRFLRDRFRIPVRAEVKANYLLHNRGPFRTLSLSENARFAVYRAFMRLQPKLGVHAFAVVIRKDVMRAKGLTSEPRDVAWEYLLQRLERFTTKGKTQALLMHDEGDGNLIRKLARRARRIGTAGSAFGTGSLKRPTRLLLDDPVSRRSDESFFLQLADLNAYAAFRHVFPPPARTVQIVPQRMWEELGDARFAPVSGLKRGPRGIVAWP